MWWRSLNYSLYQHQRPRRPCRLPPYATYPPRLPWERALVGRGGLSALMAWTWMASYSHHRLTRRWWLLIAQTRGMEGSCSTGSPPLPFPHQPRSQPPWPSPASSALLVVSHFVVRGTRREVDYSTSEYGINNYQVLFTYSIYIFKVFIWFKYI